MASNLLTSRSLLVDALSLLNVFVGCRCIYGWLMPLDLPMPLNLLTDATERTEWYRYLLASALCFWNLLLCRLTYEVQQYWLMSLHLLMTLDLRASLGWTERAEADANGSADASVRKEGGNICRLLREKRFGTHDCVRDWETNRRNAYPHPKPIRDLPDQPLVSARPCLVHTSVCQPFCSNLWLSSTGGKKTADHFLFLVESTFDVFLSNLLVDCSNLWFISEPTDWPHWIFRLLIVVLMFKALVEGKCCQGMSIFRSWYITSGRNGSGHFCVASCPGR